MAGENSSYLSLSVTDNTESVNVSFLIWSTSRQFNVMLTHTEPDNGHHEWFEVSTWYEDSCTDKRLVVKLVELLILNFLAQHDV